MARRIGSLFSGIGGLELGLERSGLGMVAWQAEIDPWCRRVLARHWPESVRFDDVRSVSSATASPVDVLCGGFPCQPVSLAGKRNAQGDARWLWPEFARIIKDMRPAIVVAENVLGLRSAGLADVLRHLAALGFDAEWSDLGAFEVGAPHIRRRIFIVATHPDRIAIRDEPGWLGRACRAEAEATLGRVAAGIATDAEGFRRPWSGGREGRKARDGVPRAEGGPASQPDGMRRLESARRFAQLGGWPEHCGWQWDPPARVDDGIPRGMDIGRRRKALGNAVVVRCAEVIGRAVIAAMEGAGHG